MYVKTCQLSKGNTIDDSLFWYIVFIPCSFKCVVTYLYLSLCHMVAQPIEIGLQIIKSCFMDQLTIPTSAYLFFYYFLIVF